MSDRPQPARITGGLGHGFFTSGRLGLDFPELLIRLPGTNGSTCLQIGHSDVTADRPPLALIGPYSAAATQSDVGRKRDIQMRDQSGLRSD